MTAAREMRAPRMEKAIGLPRLWKYLRRYWVAIQTVHFADFAFVHINKTGGSSIEVALRIPHQHKTALELRRQVGERRWSDRFSFTIVRNPWDKVVSHYYYRVTTNQTRLGDEPVGFNEWVQRTYGEKDPRYYDNPKMFLPQLEWITDEYGRIIVDYVGRFEHLEDEFRRICQIIGCTAELPHLKRSSRGDYRALYTAESVDIVCRWFIKDIETFGYEFNKRENFVQ